MQQISLNIDNQRIENFLFKLSKKKNKPIDEIVFEIINHFIKNIFIQQKNKENNLYEALLKTKKINHKTNRKIPKNIDISELANQVNDVIL